MQTALPVVAVHGRPGRDDDLGALGRDPARRHGEPRRHDVLQPLRARCRSRTGCTGPWPASARPRRPATPFEVAPRPGGGLTSAEAWLETASRPGGRALALDDDGRVSIVVTRPGRRSRARGPRRRTASGASRRAGTSCVVELGQLTAPLTTTEHAPFRRRRMERFNARARPAVLGHSGADSRRSGCEMVDGIRRFCVVSERKLETLQQAALERSSARTSRVRLSTRRTDARLAVPDLRRPGSRRAIAFSVVARGPRAARDRRPARRVRAGGPAATPRAPGWTPSKSADQRATLLLKASTLDQKLRWLDEQAANNPTQTTFSGVDLPGAGRLHARRSSTPTAPTTSAARRRHDLPGPDRARGDVRRAARLRQGRRPGRRGLPVRQERHPRPGRRLRVAPRCPAAPRSTSARTRCSSGTMAAATINGIQKGNPSQPVMAVHQALRRQRAGARPADQLVEHRRPHAARGVQPAVQDPRRQGRPRRRHVLVQPDQRRVRLREPGAQQPAQGRHGLPGLRRLRLRRRAQHRPVAGGRPRPGAQPAALLHARPTSPRPSTTARSRWRRSTPPPSGSSAPTSPTGCSTTRCRTRRRPARRPTRTRRWRRRSPQQSSVLLKNDGNVLPLTAATKTIAIIGPTASNTPTNGVSAGTVCAAGGRAVRRAAATRARTRSHRSTRSRRAPRRSGRPSRSTTAPTSAAAAAAAAAADVAVVFGYSEAGRVRRPDDARPGQQRRRAHRRRRRRQPEDRGRPRDRHGDPDALARPASRASSRPGTRASSRAPRSPGCSTATTTSSAGCR